ncbi:MAG: family 10 glycosylhydrolase [Rhodothermia bacterium]|nr:family 10 glycosylhydrolase [Rhodothermia bacterium]
MKKLLLCTETFFALLFFTFGLKVANAQGLPVYKKEVRGVWVTNVASDILNSRENIARGVDYLAKNGFNVIFPVVWNKDYTLHPSNVMVRHFGTTRKQDPYFSAQNRDPLAELIVEAHSRGIEVIPWFEYGFASNGFLVNAKPDWATKGVDGKVVNKNGFFWMAAINPDVQQFMLDLMKEVIENYDVDGIQGDDRLPAMAVEGGYDEYTVQLYKREHNGAAPPTYQKDPDWVQWRADKLTSFLGKLYRMTKKQDPNLTVSMSPSILDFAKYEYLQDWTRWLDSTYVDLVHPQAYRYDLFGYQSIVGQMVGSTPTSSGYVKQKYKHLISPGIVTKASQLNGPNLVRQMVNYHRNLGVMGEVFFYYEGMGAQNQFVADSLRKYFYKEPAVMPNRNSVWRPIPTILNESDATVIKSGTWEANSGTGYAGTVLRGKAGTNPVMTYRFSPPYSGFFDLFVWVPAGRTDATQVAPFLIKNNNGLQYTEFLNQQSSDSRWVKLTGIPATFGKDVEITIFADDVADGGAVYLDAIMFKLNRKRSPEVQIQFRTPISRETELPDQISLDQNYPNPFNPTTTIQFRLEKSAYVKLTLYDMLGRQVRTLVENRLLSAGEHHVRVDAHGLPSGLYHYRLETPTGTVVKQMTVLK